MAIHKDFSRAVQLNTNKDEFPFELKRTEHNKENMFEKTCH